VLRFPDQHLDLGELKHFSEQFGEIQGPATRGRDPTQEYPEIDPRRTRRPRRCFRRPAARPRFTRDTVTPFRPGTRRWPSVAGRRQLLQLFRQFRQLRE
jgi:hypothetical protein